MQYALRKIAGTLAGIIVLLLGVTLLSFSLMYLAPGDPATSILRAGGSMPTQAQIDQKREEMGLNRPFLQQYGDWLGNVLRGDLGKSMIDGKDVTRQITDSLGSSFLLAVLATLLGVGLALPLGVYSAVKKNSLFDRINCFLVFIRISMPIFLVALLLLYVFAYKMKLVSIMASTAGFKGMILPIVTLGTSVWAKLFRQVRGLIDAELKNPYVDGLRSRGVNERRILFSHVLKNAMLPIITLIAILFGEELGGTAITETIFSFPGIGRLVIDAIGLRDYTIVQGFVVVIAIIFCLIYGLTEASYGLFDPRVRGEGGRGGWLAKRS